MNCPKCGDELTESDGDMVCPCWSRGIARVPEKFEVMEELGFSITAHAMNGDEIVGWTYAKTVEGIPMFFDVWKDKTSCMARVSAVFPESIVTLASGNFSWPHPKPERFHSQVLDIVLRYARTREIEQKVRDLYGEDAVRALRKACDYALGEDV